MNLKHKDLKKEILKIDWQQFDCDCTDLGYNPLSVRDLLIDLASFDEQKHDAENLGNKLLTALAWNHRGCYYPAVLKALDFIIFIEQNTKSEKCKILCNAVLNDLYYFEPCFENYKDMDKETIANLVKSKLFRYRDKPTNSKLKEPRIGVDFNELIEENLVMLSQNDIVNNSKGDNIVLKEGMSVKIFEYNDYEEEEEFLLAEGIVERNPDFNNSCKWLCRIDENGIRNETKNKQN